ncbi:MAG: hypothetical protein ACOX25_00030 [Caldicoprobacterales bacterium]|jgi:hypothetical protein|nr:hypothetical protein [Clostridiales bacterium]
MFVWKGNKPHRPYKPHRPHRKWNVLSVLLILVGILLVMVYTPPWVWLVLLGLGLIAAGVLSLLRWR